MDNLRKLATELTGYGNVTMNLIAQEAGPAMLSLLNKLEAVEAKAAMSKIKRAPVQGYTPGIPWSMHLEAYDVYRKKYGAQQALIEGECRGGFGTKELDDFIPGWRDKVSELSQLRAELAERDAKLTALNEKIAALETSTPPVLELKHIGSVQHLEELNDEWLSKLPLGTKLYIAAGTAPIKSEPVPCKRCGGSGILDDGETDCCADSTPYENGPVKCIKDCPSCRGAAPTQKPEGEQG